jgi:hypothetical protein
VPAQAFTLGKQSEAPVLGELALTSTVLSPETATAEVARRQPDGSWRWILDRPNVWLTVPLAGSSVP